MGFHVGQKVVCVDASARSWWLHDWFSGEAPVEGAVYTVSRFFIDSYDGEPCVALIELHRSLEARRRWGDDIAYLASRFRPLVSRNTDISVFHAILDEVNSRETVKVG